MTNRRLELFTEALRLVPDGSALSRVCTATLPLLAVSGAVVAMMSGDDGGGGVLSTAGPTARAGFDLQFSLGEGPCRDAYDTDLEVLVGDLGHDGPGRWPVYAMAAHDQGVGATFTFPARIGAIRVGVLHLERNSPGPLSTQQLVDARVLAELCSTLIIDQEAGLDGASAPNWPDRAVVHQATGMVATQLAISLAAALARLRAYTFSSGISLDETSREVVARRLRLDP